MKRTVFWAVTTFLLMSIFFTFSVGATNEKKVKVKLPEQPEIWEIYKSLDQKEYKADLLSVKKGFDINPANEKAFRTFPGFSGPYAIELIDGDKVKIVKDSINVLEKENWSVLGLVRNETTDLIGEVIITATLKNKNGIIIEKVVGKTLIDNIRPGEPAPFKLQSKALTEDVASIEWSTRHTNAKNNIKRDLNITPSWELPFGVEKVGNYQRYDAPYPYLLHVSFDNLGGEIKDANLVVAWLTPEGKVSWIEESSLDKKGYANGVPVDGSADFNLIKVDNSNVGPLLSEHQFITWAEGK
ncbi:hypothetical protein [Bacillus sp. FJAT-27245]|uniref:hypothetical protein n=1 Tax=Bacillus sp. FJAT-27245 TaxID=1684144 RepID=UPI0006A795E6|nr:hypothetical protein [Bacillus sp. FJAT-27245]